MAAACTYCGSDVYEHDPVFVQEHENGGRRDAGQFCNYACLVAHVEEAGLLEGAACAWHPPE